MNELTRFSLHLLQTLAAHPLFPQSLPSDKWPVGEELVRFGYATAAPNPRKINERIYTITPAGKERAS